MPCRRCCLIAALGAPLGGFVAVYRYFLSTETPTSWFARVTRLR